MFLKIFLLFFGIHNVKGHGFLQFPISRNLNRYKEGEDYDFMGLNGGGASNVNLLAKSDIYLYPDTISNGEKRHGMCGDPVSFIEKYNGNVNNYNVLSTFTQGEEITIEVILTAHHMGHFEFYICDTDDLINNEKKVTQECLYQHRLLRVYDETSISPIDENYPYRYYIEPSECMEFQTNGYPGHIVKVKYKLPETLVCEHCVLQWWYFTGNSCIYEGYENFEGVDCKSPWYSPNIGYCNVRGIYPEEFWNCADIEIKYNSDSESIQYPTSQPINEPTPHPTSNKPIQTPHPTSQPYFNIPNPDDLENCKSISPRVTDEWCRQVNCDPVFEDYCSFSPNDSGNVQPLNCRSIDPSIPDIWCRNVNCDPIYKDYCSVIQK